MTLTSALAALFRVLRTVLMAGAACLASPAWAATQVLYDATLAPNGSYNPTTPGWLTAVFVGSQQTVSAEGTTVAPTTLSPLDLSARGGYANYYPLGGLVNSGFPALDRNTGFTLSFGIRQTGEDHSLNTNRAGFSVIALDKDKKGVEIAFQSDRIFAQRDDGANLFTAGESNTADAVRATTLRRWTLSITAGGYSLAQGGDVLLTGPLRDYTAASGLAGLAYQNPSFLFVGDNTTSAGSVFTLDYLAITTGPMPSSNANLAALAVSPGILVPAFASSVASYAVAVGHGTNSLTVTPTVADPGATTTVNGTTVASGSPSGAIGLGVGNTAITVVVTAADTTTTKTYTIDVTRAAFPSAARRPERIVTVAPRGGDFRSIQAAIDRAAATATAGSPALVKIAPGVYLEQVTLADYVDVEGSGSNMTRIVSAALGGTVVTGAQAELRNLTVINTANANDPGANAIRQTGNTAAGSTHLRNLTLIADGAGDNLAVRVGGGTLAITDSDITAAPTGTHSGLQAALLAMGATTAVTFTNGRLAAHGSGGANVHAAYRANGAGLVLIRAGLDGTTFGSPTCLSTYAIPSNAPVSCP